MVPHGLDSFFCNLCPRKAIAMAPPNVFDEIVFLGGATYEPSCTVVYEFDGLRVRMWVDGANVGYGLQACTRWRI